jgi:signal peptidase II
MTDDLKFPAPPGEGGQPVLNAETSPAFAKSAAEGSDTVAHPEDAGAAAAVGSLEPARGHAATAGGTAAVPGAPSPGRQQHPSYLFLAAVSVVSVVADLASKAWAVARLDGPEVASLHHYGRQPIFSLHHVLATKIDLCLALAFAQNRGGAWGLLQDEPESIRRPFFLGVSVIAIVFIVSLYRRLQASQTALRWGLPLVLGGALGNLINRVQYNFVVDFIDAYANVDAHEHHWPTFNVADVAICVGVGLMAIDMFTTRRPPSSRRVSPPSGPAAVAVVSGTSTDSSVKPT